MDDAETILHTFCVEPSQAGIRLDKWLTQVLPELSRARLQILIAQGMVTTGDAAGAPAIGASRKVAAGEVYCVAVPAPEEPAPHPEAIALDVRFEDEYLIVIDKPAGMVVHPAPGNADSTLVNALLHHCADSLSGINGVKRPGIVHRLDKDTSGLLVAAKTDMAHRGLAEQFAEHSIDRAYKAICWGIPTPPMGQIEGDIGRSPTDRKKMAIVRHGGKPALTRYRVLKTFGGAVALVECRLETGRTHQIRVHMTSIGHPLVGDPRYGRGRTAPMKGLTEEQRQTLTMFPRQALHAFQLGFMHPVTHERHIFYSEFPNDIMELIEDLENI